MLFNVKKIIKKYICIIKYLKYKKMCKKSGKTEFLIFNTPIHGNIGDHAIIYAEYKMLEKEKIKAFEIPTFQEEYYFDYIKNNVSEDAVIAIRCYLSNLSNIFIKIKKNITNSRKYLVEIKKEYRHYFKYAINSQNISLKNKIKVSIFYCSPLLYTGLKSFKERI
mgnify:CR=1 FL=1